VAAYGDAATRPTEDLMALSPTAAVMYAVGQDNHLQVYHTTDGGRTWQAGR
jgi:photosystem II stability/assembly factor-like uncharacterized protein